MATVPSDKEDRIDDRTPVEFRWAPDPPVAGKRPDEIGDPPPLLVGEVARRKPPSMARLRDLCPDDLRVSKRNPFCAGEARDQRRFLRQTPLKAPVRSGVRASVMFKTVGTLTDQVL